MKTAFMKPSLARWTFQPFFNLITTVSLFTMRTSVLISYNHTPMTTNDWIITSWIVLCKERNNLIGNEKIPNDTCHFHYTFFRLCEF